MSELEIPEGYSKNIYVKSRGGSCYEVIFNPDDTEEVFNEADGKLLPLLPQMADEIKRLRGEKKSLETSLKHFEALATSRYLTIQDIQQRKQRTQQPTREDRAFQCLQGLLANPNVVGQSHNHGWGLVNSDESQLGIYCEHLADKVLVALAKPQTEQPREEDLPTVEQVQEIYEQSKLPSGCEPFELERAKVEGAIDNKGDKRFFIEAKDGLYHFAKSTETSGAWFDEAGGAWKGYGHSRRDYLRLYCIAKPVRLPFDLAKALAGEPLITRDGSKVENFEYVQMFDAYQANIEGIAHTFNKNGRFVNDEEIHFFDLFMEASV